MAFVVAPTRIPVVAIPVIVVASRGCLLLYDDDGSVLPTGSAVFVDGIIGAVMIPIVISTRFRAVPTIGSRAVVGWHLWCWWHWWWNRRGGNHGRRRHQLSLLFFNQLPGNSQGLLRGIHQQFQQLGTEFQRGFFSEESR
jgi:hypothetical protein